MSPDPNASHRQRFGLSLTAVLLAGAAGVSYFGTKSSWEPLETRGGSLSGTSVGEFELPQGPHRDEFQTSCLICHSARLPFGQPAFAKAKWAEIVHKMVAVYGAPMAPGDEAQVVEYMLAVRPPAPDSR